MIQVGDGLGVRVLICDDGVGQHTRLKEAFEKRGLTSFEGLGPNLNIDEDWLGKVSAADAQLAQEKGPAIVMLDLQYELPSPQEEQPVRWEKARQVVRDAQLDLEVKASIIREMNEFERTNPIICGGVLTGFILCRNLRLSPLVVVVHSTYSTTGPVRNMLERFARAVAPARPFAAVSGDQSARNEEQADSLVAKALDAFVRLDGRTVAQLLEHLEACRDEDVTAD